MIAMASNRLTAAVMIGMLLLSATRVEPPRMARLDFISAALWEGCRAQAVKRLTALLPSASARSPLDRLLASLPGRTTSPVTPR